MRKIKLLTLLAFISFSSIANEECEPNLIKEDVCKTAHNIAVESQKYLPIKITETMYISSIKSEKNKLIFNAKLSYSESDLQYANKQANIDDDQVKKLIREQTKNRVCLLKTPSKSFINLGGKIEYDYIFNDGTIYDVVTINSCK